MTQDRDHLNALLKKLQNLAERGVGGEKETAERKLKKLLAENDMTESDLDDDKVSYYLFSYKSNHFKKILYQCIYKVTGSADFYKSAGTRNKIGTYCTASQKIEIELDFEFYRNLFEEEIDCLQEAFIQKQKLFPDNGKVESSDLTNLSEAELARLNKVTSYYKNMEKRTRAAMIEDKSN